MGCDHTLRLILKTNYIKNLRPKLIKCYGQVHCEDAQEAEKQRLQIASMTKRLISLSDPKNFFASRSIPEGPLRKYLRSGGTNSDKDRQVMWKYLKENSQQIYDFRNHFLRTDYYFRSIDAFESSGQYIRVANILQIQNYCKYLEAIIDVLKEHPDGEWNYDYKGVDYAKETFEKTYKTMLEKKEEHYLIFESVN